MLVVIEPGRAAVPQLIWRGHRHRHLRPTPAAAAAATVLLLRCCCCCCCLSDGVVLGLPLSVSIGATAPCLNSKFDVASPLPACDMDAVYASSAIRSPQTQPKACWSEPGLFLA